jgi:hypothetical protein
VNLVGLNVLELQSSIIELQDINLYIAILRLI